MVITSHARLCVAIIAAAAALLGACANPGGRGGPPAGSGRNPAEAGGMACRTLVDQNRETFEQTARLLALTPSQQVLWEDYAQSVRVLIDDSLRLDAYRGAHRSALAQIDDKTQAVRQRLAQMEKIATLATTLYLALDEGQKRVADRNLAATVPDSYSGMRCLAGDGPGNAGRAGGRSGRSGEDAPR